MKHFLITIIAIIGLAIPAYYRMMRPGIHSMHDFHPFRQYEFNLCIEEKIFPCRWSPNSGMGYGEPVFNFYAQFPYWIGQLFYTFDPSILNSVKATFIISIVVSGISMYIFSKPYTGSLGALVSSVLYMYAPYRAVDVWVRGALPESLAFIFFPLMFHWSKEFIRTGKIIDLSLFTLSTTLLVLTHNLSALMITPFLAVWMVYNLIKYRAVKRIPAFLPAALVSVGLAAFYILPVLLESRWVTVGKTTQSYFDYRHHFVSLNQLFISSFWGYGGSIWGPNDSMSFSVGYVHWIVAGIVGIVVLVRRKKITEISPVLIIGAMAGVSLFLTHGKSSFIWNYLPGVSFIQFPWRFLSPSVFFLSFLGGFIVLHISGRKGRALGIVIIMLAIVFNSQYFRPDKWIDQTDAQYFSGEWWNVQRSSALQDFWTADAQNLPSEFAPDHIEFNNGTGSTLLAEKKAQSAHYVVTVTSDTANAVLPIMNFPGWKITTNGQEKPFFSTPDLGLVSFSLPQGEHVIEARLSNTPIRSMGNYISLMSIGIMGLLSYMLRRYEIS